MLCNFNCFIQGFSRDEYFPTGLKGYNPVYTLGSGTGVPPETHEGNRGIRGKKISKSEILKNSKNRTTPAIPSIGFKWRCNHYSFVEG
jgi:hypothetical protein